MGEARFETVVGSAGRATSIAIPLDVPHDLAAALDAAPGARVAFDGAAFSHRRECVEWVAGARRAATREWGLRGVVEQVLAI